MSPLSRPGVSVVVPTRDRPGFLRTCLAAITPLLGPDDELVVVDSASVDPVAVAEVVTPPARLVRVDRPGASRARNAGWRAASKDLVVFTDDDCTPAEGWLDAFAARFDDPEVTFAWGRVTVPAGLPGIAEHGYEGPALARRGTDVGALAGSGNMAVRRSALAEVGGFDEDLGPGTPLRAAEDRDLQLRLLEAGGTGVFVPEAAVEHDSWRPRSGVVALHHAYGVGNGGLAVKMQALELPVAELFSNGLARTHLRGAVTAVQHRHKAGVLYALARALGVWRGRRTARRLGLGDRGRSGPDAG